jgi:hypothetical protein
MVQLGGGVQESTRTQSPVAAQELTQVVRREPTLSVRWNLGSPTGLEPHGRTRAHLICEVKPRSTHGFRATWQHRSPPQQGLSCAGFGNHG